MPKRWLFKTEPESYSYDKLEAEKKCVWDGVASNQALNHLRAVKLGDEVLIYHTGNEKAIVGLAEAISDPYPDPNAPNANDEHLLVINLKPKRRVETPLTLADIKANEAFSEFDLVRLPRLSIMPISKEYWELLQDMLKL